MLARKRHAALSRPWLDRPSRYGEGTGLPAPQRGKHVPVLGLINPHSGAGAGSDVLEVCRSTPYYKHRFFSIVAVVQDQERGGLMDVFRMELQAAREEARAMGVRTRLVCGGGDGTASFALFVLFASLRADASRADEGLADAGNGFIWSDAEMLEDFPALAQLPLGSANDLGYILGWGNRYPGDGCGIAEAARDLHGWFEAVIDLATPLSNFDVWGILPRPGAERCSFKICELDGPRGRSPQQLVRGRRQLVMKETGAPMPFFVVNYFSVGFMSYTVGRFQINRKSTPFENTLEYVRQGADILREQTPPQLQGGADGIGVDSEGTAYYRPSPLRRGRSCRCLPYSDLGFLNINLQAQVMHGADRVRYPWQRYSSERRPVRFNDGLLDLYRMHACSLLRCPGIHWHQTDKRRDMEVTYSGRSGQGVFFQWDGEARFAFSPTKGRFSVYVRRVLNIPVVIGPQYDARLCGDLEQQKVAFFFAGDSAGDREQVRQRIFRLVSGEVAHELAASRQELSRARLLREDGPPPAPSA